MPFKKSSKLKREKDETKIFFRRDENPKFFFLFFLFFCRFLLYSLLVLDLLKNNFGTNFYHFQIVQRFIFCEANWLKFLKLKEPVGWIITKILEAKARFKRFSNDRKNKTHGRIFQWWLKSCKRCMQVITISILIFIHCKPCKTSWEQIKGLKISFITKFSSIH